MPSVTMASSLLYFRFTLEVGGYVPVLLSRPQRAESGVDTVEIRNQELTVQLAQNREE